MREIKFRVYSNYYKKYLDTSGKGIFCEVHHLALKPDGKIYYADIGIDYPGTLSECPTLDWAEDYYEDCVVEQDTGLKDKNGKEIYEGDIVKVCDKHFSFVHMHPSGEWVLPQFLHKEDKPITSLLWHCDKEQVEVIGNIHENPELLKEEK